MTDLHTAARDGDTKRIAELMAVSAHVDGRDKHSRTPLHLAAANGQVVSKTWLAVGRLVS